VKVLAIGSSKVVSVFKFIGAEVVEVNSPRELLSSLKEGVKREDIGVIVLDGLLASSVMEEVKLIKSTIAFKPLVVEVYGTEKYPELDVTALLRSIVGVRA